MAARHLCIVRTSCTDNTTTVNLRQGHHITVPTLQTLTVHRSCCVGGNMYKMKAILLGLPACEIRILLPSLYISYPPCISQDTLSLPVYLIPSLYISGYSYLPCISQDTLTLPVYLRILFPSLYISGYSYPPCISHTLPVHPRILFPSLYISRYSYPPCISQDTLTLHSWSSSSHSPRENCTGWGHQVHAGSGIWTRKGASGMRTGLSYGPVCS